MKEFIVELKTHENGNWLVSGERDYQELVRCKDCENWAYVKTPKNHELTHCFLHHKFEPNGEWFCADGRKKDEQD